MQTHQLEVYSDIACPWCRLGRRRFARAADQVRDVVEVQVVHRPYQLDPEVSTPVPLPEMMADKYGPEPTRQMFAQMRELGAAEGLTFNLDEGIAVNTFTAHRLLWHAGREYGHEAQNTLTDLLFDAYFQDGRNVEEHAVLATLAQQAGLDGVRALNFLRSDDGAEEVRAQVAQARQDGVRSVPTFVFADGRVVAGAQSTEYFVEQLRAGAGEVADPAPGDSCPV